MAFWKSNDVEPKRAYKFRVQFTGGKFGASVAWYAKTVTMPSWEISEVEHDHFDNKYYFPGRITWNEVSATMVDPIDVNASGQLSNILVESGYLVKTLADAQGGNPTTNSKIKASGAGGPLNGFTIIVLNADGKHVETWTLHAPFIKSVTFGEMAYDNDDLKTVEMTIRYDWAEVTYSGGSFAETFFSLS